MNLFESLFRYAYQFMDSFTYLVLAALGLAIVFGMMGIINQAHGEFIMIGAYVFSFCTSKGVAFIFAAIIAVAAVSLFGYFVDRLFMRKLYSRPIDSIVVTFGLSLVLSQGFRMMFGPTIASPTLPLGSFSLGIGTYSVYRIVLMGISVLLLVAFYILFNYTKFGLHSRATMQKPEIAKAMGINTNFAYSATFIIGSALAGMCGVLYAPLLYVTPEIGQSFITQAFTTVVVGGANPLLGTLLSGTVLGVVNGVLSLKMGPFIGKVGLLVVAILCIRVMPTGISGMVEKISMRRKVDAKK